MSGIFTTLGPTGLNINFMPGISHYSPLFRDIPALSAPTLGAIPGVSHLSDRTAHNRRFSSFSRFCQFCTFSSLPRLLGPDHQH